MSSLQDNSISAFNTDGGLEQFVIHVPTILSSVEGQSVKDIFDQQQDAEGVVVIENSIPVGIIMRTTFFQKMGTLYGHSLYMKRPLSILMDRDFMKADTSDNISKIGIQAMNRDKSKLYDYIIVYKNKTFLGVISIRLFLLELSKRNEAQISVLKNQQQKLLSAHEQEIMLRKSLEYQSDSIRNLLDHADQGFLWFGSDLIIKNEYSYKCISIFNSSIGNGSYLDLISEYFENKISVFQMAFESYFKNNSPVTDNVYLMLLPSDCIIQGKNIHFEYRRIESGDQKAVMVILNDITDKVHLEKVMEDEQNKQRLLMKAFGCQAQIKQMLDEFREIFSGGYKSFFLNTLNFSDNLNEFFRAVHTFKGDFSQYGFINASNELHIFEDNILALIERDENARLSDVEKIMSGADPEKMLKNDLNMIYEVLGNTYFDQSEIISFPKLKLIELKERIQNTNEPIDKETVISLMNGLQRKNLKILMNQYRDYLQYLSGRLMKNMPIYLVDGDDVEIDCDVYGNFIKSLVHIYRNIMDHGIETDEERLECGKSERGLVGCRVTHVDDMWFTLCISDDGRGIDLEKIKDKAIQNHLYTNDELNHMTKSEISNLIFADHISTKDTANNLSGRGMGMSALWEACRDLGGKIDVITEEGKGTSFLITLPYDAIKGV